MSEEMEGQMPLFDIDGDETCECDQCANGGYIDDGPICEDEPVIEIPTFEMPTPEPRRE